MPDIIRKDGFIFRGSHGSIVRDDDCCECGEPGPCQGICGGQLPDVLAITVSGWTLPSFLSLNSTFLLPFAGNAFSCVWRATFRLPSGCDGFQCDNFGSISSVAFILSVGQNGWVLEANHGPGNFGSYTNGFFCITGGVAAYGQEDTGGLRRSYYENRTQPTLCNGDVILTDRAAPIVVTGCNEACEPLTETRPPEIVLHLP